MTRPRTLLVVNPRATRVTEATRDLIGHALASVADVETTQTERANHARELAAGAAAEGFDLVVALGGDGTVNEIANGILDGGGGPALAVVPGGGVDVFARTVGIPNDTVEAADLLVRLIEAGVQPRSRSLGSWNGRAFLFNAGIGLDGAVVEAVDLHPARKRRFGDAYFLLQAVKVLKRYPPATVSVRAEIAGGAVEEVSGMLAIACLSDPYTFLGKRSLRLCPDADPDAGLSMMIVEDLNKRRTLRIALRAFGRARHGRLRGVTILDRITAAEITSEPALPSQTDGEQAGSLEEVNLVHRPGALRVLAPQL